MSEVAETTTGDAQDQATPWAEFLVNTPPGRASQIRDFASKRQHYAGMFIETPDLVLYCGAEECGGIRTFAYRGSNPPNVRETGSFFMEYICRNCRKGRKIFALHGAPDEDGSGWAVKVGEVPEFGPPLPAKVQRFVQRDRELFLKGYRAERQGLGVGAFAYYRRIVEDHKDRFIEAIERIAAQTNAPREMLQTLKRARGRHRFKEAVEEIQDAIPQAVFIDGHNPLTVLHRALSRGIHELTDEECLDRATTVRLVLTAFVERISELQREDGVLKDAMRRLMSG